MLVFNCDESFDYGAMGRLFAGLAEVGAWGCFDEFNRLDERILSACSQQILAIQHGLQQRAAEISLLGRAVRLHSAVGIFVTMNPDYAGRSNLPDNLKRLFRAVAMVRPDRAMIAQTALFAHGIASAEELAAKVVLLFELCAEQLSGQAHYDFGLRALKSVLVMAGQLKRDSPDLSEDLVLMRALRDMNMPKFIYADVPLFRGLIGNHAASRTHA